MNEYFVGVDIGGTNIRFGLFDDNLSLLDKRQIHTADLKDKSDFLNILKSEIDSLNKEGNVKKVSIVLPAPYSENSTTIEDITNIPCIENMKFTEIREVLSDYNVYFENDVNVIALLESNLGVGKNHKNVIYITFSTGIGSGVVVDNRIYNGANGYAGEIGSIIIDSTKEDFLEGTLENQCSGKALSTLSKEIYGVENAEHIFKMFEEKDQKATDIIEDWRNKVSTGIANVVQLFDPDIIVLGGPIITCNEWVTKAIYEDTKGKLLGKLSEKLKIEKTIYGSDAGLIGAVYYAQKSI